MQVWVIWWIFHFGIFAFICKQLHERCSACVFGNDENNSNGAQKRGGINCNDLIHHSHMARPEDIEGTNCYEMRTNNEGGIGVTLRRGHSELRGFAHNHIIMIRCISRSASRSSLDCLQFWWFTKLFKLQKWQWAEVQSSNDDKTKSHPLMSKCWLFLHVSYMLRGTADYTDY